MPLRSDSIELLENWFQSQNIQQTDKMLKKIEIYYDLLYEWSGKINLVSSRDRELLIENHILDSLSPVELLQKPLNIVDIGSGGGFPAIPLSIVCPHLNIVMVESREKKVLFLKEAIKSLESTNLDVYLGRIEDYQPEKLFDYATVRAVTLTPKIKKAIFNILKPLGGIIYYEKRGKCRIIKPEK